jgi:hypothetical protein
MGVLRKTEACGGGLAVALALAATAAASSPPESRRVPRPALLAAMGAEKGYDRHVTTNQARLQTRVFLRLAREAAERGEATPLFIDHEDWFQAYLETVGLPAERAPFSVRLSHQHQYDITLDARPGVVIESVPSGPLPSLALNVRWRSRRGTARYSYRDPNSRPILEMSFDGTVTYRLLELDGMVCLDQITGVAGRPVTGPLTFLFRLLGSARAIWSRSALTGDSWQVVVGQGRKGPISRTATVIIRPDGQVEPASSVKRSDVAAIEARLRRPVTIDYRPWTLD